MTQLRWLLSNSRMAAISRVMRFKMVYPTQLIGTDMRNSRGGGGGGGTDFA